MATRIYCDICGKEIAKDPAEEIYELRVQTHDHWDKVCAYNIKDMCRTCYLDICDIIQGKIKFYHDKHVMEDGCKLTM